MKEEKIIAFLKERMISQDEAIKILEKNLPFKNTWKMWRFTLYLWERVKEYNNKGIKNLGTRKEAVERVVRSGRYKRLYDTFPLPKFNAETEIKNLTQLIAEPRQDRSFKEGNFRYEHKDKIIPQGHINEIR